MCGRFSQVFNTPSMFEVLGFTGHDFQFEDQTNCVPGGYHTVVYEDQDRVSLDQFQFGLIPHWSKVPSLSFSTFNARIETVQEKPTFRRPFESQRCLVYCSGFYEWVSQPNGKKTTVLYSI